MKRQISSFSLLIVICALFHACEDPINGGITPPSTDTHFDAWVLNEGLWGNNNASLSRLSTSDGYIENNYFARQNGKGLGDIAHDILVYGSKCYITVTKSNTIWVIDNANGNVLAQLPTSDNPRYLAEHNGKVYATVYDKTVLRIDTATLAIDGTCRLSGYQPEQLTVAAGRLYVANSWQTSSTGDAIFDSTLSVVDLATFSETGKITVALDPCRLAALDANRLVVLCGNGYNVDSNTLLITLGDNGLSTDITKLPVALANITVHNGDLYGYTSQYGDNRHQTNTFYRIDGHTLQATPLLAGYASDVQDAYGIALDDNGNLYVLTSHYNSNSDILCFNADGVKRWKREAALFASKVVFY